MQKFRTQLLTAATLLALTGTTYAADMAVRKAPALPPAPPPFSWNGWYVGIAGGAGWGTIESQLNNISFNSIIGGVPGGPAGTVAVNNPFSQDQINGWLFGGQVGYNWQANPWLVLGIEGDFDWTDIEGTTPCGVTAVFGCHTKVKWTADVAARVGFVVDRALIYAKGGVVWANADHSVTCSGGAIGCGPPFLGPSLGFNATNNDTRTGGLFGAGIEYAFLPNWSAKVEYNFMDFGTKGNNFGACAPAASPPAPPGTSTCFTSSGDLREVIHTIKFGVNYRFDWGNWGGWGR